jgi:DNA-binding NarL/FixJ family response regulator
MRAIESVHGPLIQLSPRECDVGPLLVRGFTNKTIGDMLDISGHTVKRHIDRMKSKLGLNKTQLVVFIVSHPECVRGLAVPSALVLPFETAS